MSKRLVVAVSQRVDIWTDRGERRDALDQRLSAWLLAAGCWPVPVPNVLGTPFIADAEEDSPLVQDWLKVVRPGAVLLSGGNDVGDVPERDAAESCLLTYAKQQRLPVLGICRGMQMMAIWSGGALVPKDGHVRTRHRLQGVEGTDPWPEEVNSYHRLALADCPPGFMTSARAEDGEIEAIRHVSLAWEGWMWHPEREVVFNQRDALRLKRLFSLTTEKML